MIIISKIKTNYDTTTILFEGYDHHNILLEQKKMRKNVICTYKMCFYFYFISIIHSFQHSVLNKNISKPFSPHSLLHFPLWNTY